MRRVLVKKCNQYNKESSDKRMSKAVLKKFRNFVSHRYSMPEAERMAWNKTEKCYRGHMRYRGTSIMRKEIESELKEIRRGLSLLSPSERKQLRKSYK